MAFWGSRSGTTPAPVTPPGTPATRVAEGPAQHAPRPRWDAEQRRLWLGDRLLREFKGHPAPNLVELLGEFERRGWPVSVPVRFRGEQLAQTWKYLNRVLPPHTIRFGGDGTGSGVRWFFV